MTRSSKLPVVWTSHLKDADAKQEFEEIVRHSRILLTRLDQIISQKLTDLTEKQISEESFENPGWAYHQAYLNGRRAALRDIQNLFSFLKS